MIDLNMLKPAIQQIFKGSGSAILSKQAILSRLAQFPIAQKFLPLLRQVPERNDYTESSLTGELQNLQKKGTQGGSPVDKIRSKIGV